MTPVPPARVRATKPTRQSSGVDAAVLGQAAADAAEHLVGAAAAQLRAGRRAGRRGRGLPGRRVQRRRAGGRCRGGRSGCHGQKPADPAGPEPSGKAPIRPWFLNGGDHRCRPGGARCDDRYRDHHCDRGAAPRRPPRGRRSCAPGRAGCSPASRPGRRRTCGRTRSSSGSRSPSWRRPGIGVVAYGLLWLTMPVAAPGEEPEPGAVAARRPAPAAVSCSSSSCSGSPPSALLGQVCRRAAARCVLPLILVAAGLAVIWRQLDTDRTLAVPGGPLGAGRRRRRWPPAAWSCCWPRPVSWPTRATASPRPW